MRYSIFSLARNALSHHERWPRAWAQPGAPARVRRRDHRRRRTRPRRRVLPRQAARHHPRRGGGEGLARWREHRPQHHHRALELPAGAERALLRAFAEAVGGALARPQLQRDVQPARGGEPDPYRHPGGRGAQARQRDAAERHRRRVAVGRRNPGDGAAARLLCARAFPGERCAGAAPRGGASATTRWPGGSRGPRTPAGWTSSRTAK